MQSTALALRGLQNIAAIAEPLRLRAQRRRYQTIRRTGKPHIFTENGEWCVLEKTAPGEWWLTPFEKWPA